MSNTRDTVKDAVQTGVPNRDLRNVRLCTEEFPHHFSDGYFLATGLVRH
jgi:hypothetical protein